MLEVKVKRLTSQAILPTYATDGSACFDLYAAHDAIVGAYHENPDEIQPDRTHRHSVVGTDLAFEIPQDHVMLVFSRSGHGFKNQVRLQNCVGVIDSDYRGEVKVALVQDSMSQDPLVVKAGDRIAQALVLPVHQVAFHEVNELSDTVRGNGGFGSTGA